MLKGINVTFLAGILLAAISLFFSATGLVHLFAGAGTAIMVLAGAFELAKVVITVFVARNGWRRAITYPLTISLLFLSAISSLGIYGYLGNAYNSGRSASVDYAAGVAVYTDDVAKLEAEKERYLSFVEEIPDNQGTNLRKMIATVRPHIAEIDETLTMKRDSLNYYRRLQANTANDIGELKYAASLFGTTQDGIAKFVITVLAFLLDPLAVLLVAASGVKGRTAEVVVPIRHQQMEHEHTEECTPSNCDISGAEYEARRQDRVTALQDAAKNGLSPGLNRALRSHRRRGGKVVANEQT